MTSTGVRNASSIEERVNRALIKDEAQFIQSLKIFSNTSIVGSSGAQSAGASNSPSIIGNFLRKEGDFMIGQLALNPILITIIDNIIDATIISEQYSSRLIVNGQGAADDDIEQILSEKTPGTIMIIQGIIGQTLTIKHLAKGGADQDIRTPDDADFLIVGNQNVTLIYDAPANEWAFMDEAIANAGANKALSNLVDVAFNTALLPGSGGTIDIGDTTFDIRDIFVEQIRLQPTAVIVANKPVIAQDGSDNIIINFPTGKKIIFRENNVDVADISGSSITHANAIFSATLNSQGDTTLGINSADRLTINAELASNLNPDGDGTRNIGLITDRFSVITAQVFRLPTTTSDSTTRFRSDTDGVELQLLGGDVFEIFIDGSRIYSFAKTGTGDAFMFFNISGQKITTSSAGIIIEVPTGDTLTLAVNAIAIAIATVNGLVIKTFTDASRPTPGAAGPGCVIFNSDDGGLNVSDGTNWRNPSGGWVNT